MMAKSSLKSGKPSATNKIAQGNAAQLLVASELNRRGWSAAVTLGNAPDVDVLCANEGSTKFVFIQVKSFHLANKSCAVGKKAENQYGPNFFWVVVGLSDDPAEHDAFYVVPAKEMAANVKDAHCKWLKTPGKNGASRNDNDMRKVCICGKKYEYDISQWKDRWDLIEGKLK